MDENTPEKPAGRFQYSLKGLLLFTTWFAMLCAVAKMSVDAGFSFLFISLVVLGVFSRRWRSFGCSGVAVLLLLVFLWDLGSHPSAQTRRRDVCSNKIRDIARAVSSYRQEHGSFPPAYIADKNGKPMHSWRVLILPYLDCQPLYDAYDFNEPWDGPNNRKLADICPNLFRCPSELATGSSSQNTSYVAVVGPHAAWTGATRLRQSDFQDGESNTILIVETANSGINWMEPRDLAFRRIPRIVNPKAGPGISSEHTGGAHAAFADGCVRFLRKDLPSQTLEALLTRDGGEDVDTSQY